ncbi:inositol 2-dehydrogenase [Aneurinibacillus migulanus]|uniref:Myo-inositol 2-dehydrogenase n=1 Tax=Aneurinibacillus migulanus TaxID=47500 RepID=A0A0D1Y337_ANEMI|nr:inositol 2-dehydrogenase [Aneurinibacillus migulanus]KIV53672.1 oxidoreductase [Aneurinibacillus migulanus]KON97671.1 oxidoreductase [Aneurinibacillus migulanus]MED0894427.1 inositol 2-dehydrogenase [Aneurinibacillus migulanus]MED1617037.1 inositol 2-dehydrogenase [Aneurinibacillus migulanus]SDJ35610.1 myo-inositol 2-dehydrogenase [Aneurinibacillus migulanus]
MKETIRCAVLGLGRLGYWHAENLATRIKGAQLVCVADPLDGQAEKVAGELGVKQWTKDPSFVFNNPDIEAVIIATPTSTHAEMIKEAAQNGKHVFVEKPLTQHIEEADEVIATIQKHHVMCQVGFMRRFDSAYAEAKRRILAGDIGQSLYFKGVSRDPGSPPPEFIKNSGGIFLDMAIHDYDIARFLMGAEIESVSSQGSILLNTFMEEYKDVDQALTYITFDSGAAGDIESSRNASYGYDIRGEVVGTEGTLVIGSLKYHDVQILTTNGSTHDIVPAFPQRFQDSYLHEMTHFIDCLRKGEKPSVTEMDGKIALEIATAAKKSFETGNRIFLTQVQYGSAQIFK